MMIRTKPEGGTFISGKHVYMKSNGRWDKEQRILMERLLRRPLQKNEVVHHKNENTLDNRLENLQLMTKSEHDLHHKKNRSREHRQRASEHFKKLWATPKYRELFTSDRRKRVKDPVFLKKRGDAIKKSRNTPESKAKTSEQMKRQWADPIMRERLREKIRIAALRRYGHNV